ncbi:hypothetical protein [Xenorhabdus sp. PB30.3]|uniref:hypothetical protein n=1 Tax=Xenorhabdus sp. PB30.3 TaxID=2788941 RepID=UPI001E52BD18|nr:hypothetical protein [Xenorhabdus sp. PB30.3]MCC8380076.1 hypothetical protein [Xenorhabdus sp. PB30.3]
MDDDLTHLIRAFILDENKSLEIDEQGGIWPRNHHHIKPYAARLSKRLTPEERVLFYFHYMRVQGTVPAVATPEIPLLLEAYRKWLPLIDQYGAGLAKRHVMLFIFGFDDTGVLSVGELATAADLKTRLKTLHQIQRYTRLVSQRDKKMRFQPFTAQSFYLLEILRHLQYQHDHDPRSSKNYNTTNLTFWGMVLIVLLNKATRTHLVRDMLEGTYSIPDREHHLSILNDTVLCILPECEPDETDFINLAERLAFIEKTRREATESVALATSLNLPFASDQYWEIEIYIPQLDDALEGFIQPSLYLRIQPDPDYEWNIELSHSPLGRFCEWSGKITQNDLKLTGLGKGNLADLPKWLHRLHKEYKITLNLSKAEIYTSGKRSTVKLIKEWLNSMS